MTEDFYIIIPARYQSVRFPGKLLANLDGMSVLERTYRQAVLAGARAIIIATDHESIIEEAKAFGSDVMMTSPSHPSGTDRIAEVVEKRGFKPEDIIVNVQGDEPFIQPELIQQVAQALTKTQASMSTLCWPIDSFALLHNPHVVKVVRSRQQEALYFSRSPIPACRDNKEDLSQAYRHIGLYAYRAAFLSEYVRLPHCALEESEALEQLRVLWAGHTIYVEQACVKPLKDINTPLDLENCRERSFA